MTRSVVELPSYVREPFQVYISGVRQEPGDDFTVEDRKLIFAGRELRKDKVSGWRWFLGAWGVGTYRQDDQVDVRYEVNGAPRVAQGLPIKLEEV